MTEIEFEALAAHFHNRIPVSLETFADLDTPLSIYLKLAGEPFSYLLESVHAGSVICCLLLTMLLVAGCPSSSNSV